MQHLKRGTANARQIGEAQLTHPHSKQEAEKHKGEHLGYSPCEDLTRNGRANWPRRYYCRS